ncbi:hypothetical protein VTP01DRAFT_9804 [Rhizomucor pusillus]|uniref:uncharacterized protein n=1 Tax=Rhizomucor pusillus TaxID=4840 RepID=UPI0037426746
MVERIPHLKPSFLLLRNKSADCPLILSNRFLVRVLPSTFKSRYFQAAVGRRLELELHRSPCQGSKCRNGIREKHGHYLTLLFRVSSSGKE